MHSVRIITELEVTPLRFALHESFVLAEKKSSAHDKLPMLSLRLNWAPQFRIVSAAAAAYGKHPSGTKRGHGVSRGSIARQGPGL